MKKSHKKNITRKSKYTQHQKDIVIKNEEDLWSIIDALNDPPFLLILDEIQDPHNLGACLRSADAAGIHAVIIPKNRSVSLTNTVRNVASGGAEHVPLIQVINLVRVIKQLKERGLWIIGTADAAKRRLYEINLTGPLALVMGNEGKGLRRLISENCDFLAYIPMHGYVSCLNVSVATGIVLFEAVRQRIYGK